MVYYGLTWRPATDNLGDDLVTLAALQHLPRIDRVLDADALDAPLPDMQDDDRLVLLASGLFLRSSAHWPPEGHIAQAYTSPVRTPGAFPLPRWTAQALTPSPPVLRLPPGMPAPPTVWLA